MQWHLWNHLESFGITGDAEVIHHLPSPFFAPLGALADDTWSIVRCVGDRAPQKLEEIFAVRLWWVQFGAQKQNSRVQLQVCNKKWA